ncbi:MAG: hypothetical protein ACX939_00600 [Hyphococcus sp.]
MSAAAQSSPRCPHPLFATGFDRQPIYGSKEALADVVERGEPIRIGWELDFDDNGEPDILHWTDASYLSVWEGEVYAQVQAIHRQRPVRGEGDMVLPDAFSEWRASLGTTGRVDGAFSNGEKTPSIPARILWCAASAPDPVWTPVYKNGLNGEPLEGSKADLFAAIRAGQPIQIGWGLSREIDGGQASVEHLAAPVFIGIGDNDHVVAQLPEHVAPRSYWGANSAFFDDPAVLWRGLMSTNGTFDAVWANRATGDVVRRSPQRAVMTWYVRRKAPATTPSLAIPRGVIGDESRADERFPR